MSETRKQTWQWAVEVLLILATVVVAIYMGYHQLQSVDDALSSSAAAAVYEQQQAINEIFVDHPEMQPYFWEGEPVPAVENAPANAEVEANANTPAVAEALSFQLLDHFEHVRYQIENGLFESDLEAWEATINDFFASSPILCETLLKDNEMYSGTGPETLWGKHAEEPCGQLGIRDEQN